MLKYFLFSIFLVLLSSPAISSDDDRTLRLYNWEDYMPQFVLDDFEKQTGYHVEQIYYASDELKEELIIRTGGKGMDLIMGASDGFMNYISQGGVISKFDPTLTPNLAHIDPSWNKYYPGLSDHAAPFLWGTLGIIYRKDLVKQHVSSWADILQPDESLHGKILMLQDRRILFTPALKLLGSSSNETKYENLQQAAELLNKQQPHVASYKYFDISEESELIVGSIWMALAYNGDALALRKYSDNIEYIVPKEGTFIWADYIAILEASTKKPAAHAFINYINSPEIAAKLAESLNYASPNLAANKLLSKEFLNDPLIYPPIEVINKSEVLLPIKGRTMSYYNNIYTNLLVQ